METHKFTINLNGQSYSMSTYKQFEHYYGTDASFVEPNTRSWFWNNVKPNDIVFDIGANIGLYSVLFSNLTNNTYSFEPTDTYETFLLPNLQNNNINNVKPFKLAIGESSGNIEEKIYKIWGESPIQTNYQFTTIDEFCHEKKIIPNFIKIDVDGFDYEVLKGGLKILTNNDNIVVCVEINYALHTRNYKEQEVIEYMNNLGYNNFLLLDNENYLFKKYKTTEI